LERYVSGFVNVGFDTIIDFFYKLAEAMDRFRENGE